ncbi:MAG: hypothetical protein M1826_005172 [Phylliscum demangeonii]|nr:MAG: hypothetical protein M1826_005172 [Phylliscum demangeonii]
MPRGPGKARKVAMAESWGMVEESVTMRSRRDSGSDYEDRPTRESAISKRRAAGQNLRPRTKSLDPDLVMPRLDTELDITQMDDYAEHSRPSSKAAPPKSADKLAEIIRRLNPPPPAQTDDESLAKLLFDVAWSALGWVAMALRRALKILSTPLSFAVALAISGLVIYSLFAMLWSTIGSYLPASSSTICRLPVISTLCELPSWRSNPVSPVEFDEVMNVQGKFENVLQASTEGMSLPYQMKQGEASIRDLRELVRYSSLRSKNELVLEFDSFIEMARKASYDLLKYNVNIGGAVDMVVSITRWTMRVLDDLAVREASKGSIQIIWNDVVLTRIGLGAAGSEAAVLEQYIQHTRVVEEEINKLIQKGQALLEVLQYLEDHLDVIQGISARENVQMTAEKEELLAHLWTAVGGNRDKLSKVNRQMRLVESISMYRKTAYKHVSGTVTRLQEIGAGLEDLRQRVSGPEVQPARAGIPLVVHLGNIQSGVERLEVSRDKAKALRQQNWNTVLGPPMVERAVVGAVGDGRF